VVQDPPLSTCNDHGGDATKAFQIRAFGFTHVGKVRSCNEDSLRMGDFVATRQAQVRHAQTFKLQAAPVILAVADGVGSRPAGDLASGLVLENLSLPSPLDARAIREAINMANAALYVRMAEQPDTRGMGSTLAGVAVDEDGVTAFGVGDSSVGRFTGFGLLPLLESHTRHGLPGGALLQLLGGQKQCTRLVPSIVSLPLGPMRLLVATDGVMRYVGAELLSDWAPQCLWPEEFATILERKILQTSADDNLTAIAVEISPAAKNDAASGALASSGFAPAVGETTLPQ